MNLAASVNRAVRDIGIRGQPRRGGVDRAGVDRPRIVGHIQTGIVGQHVHIGVPQGFQRADIFPIAFEAISYHLLMIAQHGGNDILSEVVLGLGIVFVLRQILAQGLP